VVAHVELRDAAGKVLGTRDLRGDAARCQELSSAITLAISIAIDPVRAAAPAASAPASAAPAASSAPPVAPAASSAPPAPLASAPAASASSGSPSAGSPSATGGAAAGGATAGAPSASAPSGSAPDEPWRLGALAGGGVVVGGGAASLAPELHAGAVLERGALAFGLAGRAVLPSRRDVTGGTLETSLIGVAPPGCLGRTLRLCVPLFLGALRGAAHDIERPVPQTTFFATAGVQAQARWRLGPVSLAVQLGADATLTRTAFFFREASVWQTPLFGAGMGVEAQWLLL
jgi:hypothetical protein